MKVKVEESFDRDVKPSWIIRLTLSEGKMSTFFVIHPNEDTYSDWIEWCTNPSPSVAVGRISRNGDTYNASGDEECYWCKVEFESSTLAEKLEQIIRKGKKRGYFRK
jgi:hypothetical protein